MVLCLQRLSTSLIPNSPRGIIYPRLRCSSTRLITDPRLLRIGKVREYQLEDVDCSHRNSSHAFPFCSAFFSILLSTTMPAIHEEAAALHKGRSAAAAVASRDGAESPAAPCASARRGIQRPLSASVSRERAEKVVDGGSSTPNRNRLASVTAAHVAKKNAVRSTDAFTADAADESPRARAATSSASRGSREHEQKKQYRHVDNNNERFITSDSDDSDDTAFEGDAPVSKSIELPLVQSLQRGWRLPHRQYDKVPGSWRSTRELPFSPATVRLARPLQETPLQQDSLK